MQYNLRELGIVGSATEDDIKRAYRKLAMRWHPDRHPPEKKAFAEERFKRIQKAYKELTEHKLSIKQVVETAKSKVLDVVCVVYMTLQEWYKGAQKKVALYHGPQVACVHCSQQGCAQCAFQGKLQVYETSVYVPSGFPRGESLVLRGMGLRSKNERGDLHLKIQLVGEYSFELRGQADIQGEIALTPVQLRRGCKVWMAYPLMGEKARLKVVVPRGTKPHQLIRLSGYGFRKPSMISRGDLYLRIRVQESPPWWTLLGRKIRRWGGR